uniref:MPN domain-containing protein n=1 Tax=Canis lupus familiaris TaxID=9615 RepID=A0A8C0SLT9_CANLF
MSPDPRPNRHSLPASVAAPGRGHTRPLAPGPRTPGPPGPPAPGRGPPAARSPAAATRRDRRDLPPCPGCPRPEKRESAREAPRDRGGLAAPEVTRAEAGQRRERRERPGRAALRRRREAALRRRPARSASGERVRRARVGFPRRERSIGRAGTRGPAGLSMPGVKLTTQAYCKMVLHGAKYPHCAVNGLLVAEKQKPRKEHLPLGGPGAHHTLFVDCIPLFHGTLALAPMLEVALTLIDSWCKDNSYVIAGYYQANERVKDASPNQVAEKVASRIAEGFSDTALIMVDNTKFTMDCVVPTIHVYEHHENRWRCRDPHYDYCEDWPEAQRISASLLDSRSYETLVDFDNHLDDIRNDWTNPEINKAVLHLC